VPNTREQDDDATTVDLLSFVGDTRFEITLSLSNIHYLIGVKYSAIFPRKVMIYRMAPRWILASR